MAIVSNVVTGRTRKSAGGMVFYTVLGKNVMRTKPFQYRDAKSPLQMSRRDLMNYATKRAIFLKPLYILYGLKKASSLLNIYPHNLITSFILKSSTVLNSVVDWNPLGLSFGSNDIPSLGAVSYQFLTGNNLVVNWDKNIPGNLDKLTDVVSCVVIGIDEDFYGEELRIADRASEQFTLNLSFPGASDGRYAVFVQCQSADKLKNSVFECIAIVDYIA